MCHPQVVVLNGCASLFSALATVLCEVGGKWTMARSALGAALYLHCPQLPAFKLHPNALGHKRLLEYRGLTKWLDKTPRAQQFPGEVSVMPGFWAVAV